MITYRVARAVIVAGSLVIALTTTVADAQPVHAAATCVIAQRDLTTSEQSLVNDYEVQVAKANSKHTPVPPMPDPVVALIGCESPASQVSPSSSTGSSSASTTPSTTPSSAASTSSGTSTTFTCPPNGLSKQQQSMINDFEILVARANSKHTPVPTASPDIAALIACQ